MDLSHLSYFSVLCETLNYTKAAKLCFISRQAMRQSVQTLEQIYGVCLIENRHNRLTLTSAGKFLYEKAQPVLGACREMNEAMRGCFSAAEALRIGISRSITPYYAPEVLQAIRDFTEYYPKIPVETVLLTEEEVAQGLDDGSLSAGVLVEMEEEEQGKFAALTSHAAPIPVCPRFRRTVLRRDPLTLLLSANHPLAEQENITLEELDGQTLMVMGTPEQFFFPLYRAALERGVRIHWQVVPDFYEVSYRILQGDCLAIDRQEGAERLSTDVDRNLPLEYHAFTLSCSLLTPETESAPVQLLRRALESMERRGGI